jgi:hypothetical protein
MENHLLSKTFVAGAEVKPYRIVKHGTNDGEVMHAGAASIVPFVGVSANIAAVAAGGRVEVARSGMAEVEYGDTVSGKGVPLTSDSVGRAIPATIDGEDAVFIIGYSEFAGAAGDIREIQIDKAIVPAAAAATEGDLLVANVTITSAQLLALNAVPKTLISSPGSNKAIVVEKVIAYKASGTAYAGIATNEDVAIRYTDGSGTVLATLETTGFLDQTSAQTRVAVPTTTANLTPTADAALVAHMTSGEITTGDSDLKLRILYRIIDTVL